MMKLEEPTNVGKMIRQLDFTREIVIEQRKALDRVAKEAAAKAPNESGDFAEGFLQRDTVQVKKKGDEVVAIVKNEVEYGPHILGPGGVPVADTLVYEPVEEAAYNATIDAIVDVLRRRVR